MTLGLRATCPPLAPFPLRHGKLPACVEVAEAESASEQSRYTKSLILLKSNPCTRHKGLRHVCDGKLRPRSLATPSALALSMVALGAAKPRIPAENIEIKTLYH